MNSLHEQLSDLFYPLTDFYASHDVTLPIIEPIEGESMPSPWRELLVHEQDMTSKLSTYWKSTLTVRVLEKHEVDSQLIRQVVLMTQQGQPTEFGAIRICLDRFSPQVRAEILACNKPLGALLKEHEITYFCKPNAFFAFRCDNIARKAFGLDESPTLYGRHNLLLNDRKELLAEVVEILPPLDDQDPSR